MPAKRKHHEIIQNIGHKHCGKCDKWKVLNQFGKYKLKWDGLHTVCKVCRNQRVKLCVQQRQKARQEASIGLSVCLFAGCIVKKWLQPVDQFIDVNVHVNIHTRHCLTCRNKIKANHKRRRAACRNVWDEWRKQNKCIECSKDPTHVHNYLVIEADHLPEFNKVERCSAMEYWVTKSRGIPALLAELKKCQPLCRFHHALQTQQRRHSKGHVVKQASILKRRAVINKEKHKRGCCKLCERVLKKGEECAFHFDHRDPTTKFIRNGKVICPSHFAKLPQALFDTQWPLEQAKCDLLCANCDKMKTFANKDGYKK